MPNRILKESIRESDSIDSLTWFEEVLFYRLIVSCDDYGRFDGRISVIKNRLFPLKENLTLKTVSCAIDKLVTAGLVALYEFEGKPYLYLPTWTAHQNVRAKRSKYPEPGIRRNNMNTSASKCIPMQSHESNGQQPQVNAPVIQSNAESVSLSESISESISDGGDACAREADERELLSIGLKKEELRDILLKKGGISGPGGCGIVTRERVNGIVEATEGLFRKYRPTVIPSSWDRRMVFTLSDGRDNCELLDYAFEQAQMAGNVNDWRYIAGVMRSLQNRNITTVQQAREWDEQRPDLNGEEAVASVNNLLRNIQGREAAK